MFIILKWLLSGSCFRGGGYSSRVDFVSEYFPNDGTFISIQMILGSFLVNLARSTNEKAETVVAVTGWGRFLPEKESLLHDPL